MISVTTCYESGNPVDTGAFPTVDVAVSFVKHMWQREWADHFIVETPEWKIIVRRRKHG